MTDTRYDPQGGTATEHHDLTGGWEEPGTVSGPSTLDLLREAAEAESAAATEDDAAGKPLIELYSLSGVIRVDCSPEQISYEQLHAARKGAVPQQSRKARRSGIGINWDDLNPAIVAARLIAEQTVAIYLMKDGVYQKLVDAHGKPYDFTDPHLLASFGTADAQAAVRKIFGTDPHLLDAGEELLAHSGWSATGDLDDPPQTQKRNDARG